MQYERAPTQVPPSFTDVEQVVNQLDHRAGPDASVTYDEEVETIIIDGDDAVFEQRVAKVIRAIRYGFNSTDAFDLLDIDAFQLQTINISANTRNDRDFRRQKGRIIGKDGRTLELMEELTGASVSVNGKVVAAIGTHLEITTVRQAVSMFLQGKSHGSVYAYLEQQSTSDPKYELA